ncbi:MAG TPA: hypothetical protein VJS44_07385 [Pyrinomonadaceae bacterium]|nr:hypothetical protein [Pyrinomonadaceae bacterium]
MSAIACCLLVAVSAQFVSPAAALADSARLEATSPQASEITLPDGLEFEVVTTEEISSKTATEGDPLTFKVAEDVKVNGQVVIAKDAIVKGTVSNAEKSGRMGKSGKLGIRIESTTTTDGQKLRLRASKGKTGDDKTGTVIALSVLVSPLFLLKRGKDAKIKPGTKLKVFSDEEKKVQIKAAE